jgi:L-lactate dehydrogenase complex protein LldF
MKGKPNNFLRAARAAINDSQLQAAIATSTHNSDSQRSETMFAFGQAHGERMRQQAAEAKRRALRNLPELLERAEAHMQANGIHVLWAEDGQEACRLILEITQRHGARRIVKSKSMLTEEIGLNPVLQSGGIEVSETDLGEYIVQLSGEPPSHIVGPALHLSKDQIRDLFVRELGMPFTDDAEEMTRFVRQHLRQAFLEADMGISGGNFIIAETGTLCLVTNEGNGRMATSLPPVHVAVVGIEKIVETFEDYAILVQILARSGTGQTITVYNHMIQGPRRNGESDGPDEVYVILVDNGRSSIYATDYAEVLACLRCGACLNTCPVYRAAGGHAYGSVYSGPIGAVITPLLTGLENATLLPYASSLCGKCKAVCPVDIDLPRMLLDLRRDLVEQGHSPALWTIGMRSWATANRLPRLFEWAGRLMRWSIRLAPRRLPGPVGRWTRYRDLPPAAPQAFRELWRERQKEGEHGQSK